MSKTKTLVEMIGLYQGFCLEDMYSCLRRVLNAMLHDEALCEKLGSATHQLSNNQAVNIHYAEELSGIF